MRGPRANGAGHANRPLKGGNLWPELAGAMILPEGQSMLGVGLVATRCIVEYPSRGCQATGWARYRWLAGTDYRSLTKASLVRKNEFERLRVVLVNTRNPLNIGAAARAISNFGFKHLRVVNPFEAAFREARSAVGAAPLLAQAEEFQSVADAVADCSLVVGTTALSRRNPEHVVRHLPEGVRLVRKRLARSKVALLFGSEKRGLSNQDFSYCHWLLHIPTCETRRSMNLGQAVAVCLYELSRDAKRGHRSEAVTLARASDLERLTSLLLDALRSSGYLKSRSREDSAAPSATREEERIRRFVRRMNLSSADADQLTGILRQILWKVSV